MGLPGKITAQGSARRDATPCRVVRRPSARSRTIAWRRVGGRRHGTSGRSGRSVTISQPPEVPLRAQSATITISHAVTAAGGVFAPGHLGELTQYLPFELVDDVLEQTRTVQRRLRLLPSRAGVYFMLAPDP